MRLEKLKELYETCKTLPNYQYKDLTETELLEKAKTSFQRLPDNQQKKVLKSWKEKTGDGSLESVNQLLLYRFMSQTNLFFLCHLLEKYNQTTVQTHEEICNKFFVQKDPTFTTFEAFANQYTDLKERMLLVPRNGFKSSIDIADCVQWAICFPEVTILILTGVYSLATDFVGEAKQHFTLDQTNTGEPGKPSFGPRRLMDKITGEWSDSLFQVLFPEHCVTPTDGNQLEFQTPAGGDDKEPTIRAASIEQALSGMHFGVLKLDDVVTNENSGTLERINKVNKQISINKAMLNPHGFFDIIGTWYDECLVGETLITMSDWSQKPIKDVKIGDEVVGFTNEHGKRSMLVKSKVTHVFASVLRPVYKYTFNSGRYVTSTDSHLWWKGANGSESTEYSKIGFKYHDQKFVRRLLIPRTENFTKETGYLAGIYDGEGSFQKNPEHPSGTITICQTQHNPEIVNSIRKSLDDLGYEFTESVYDDYKHNFKLLGGWQTRYKFLTEINPIRRDVISESLFGQNVTEKDYLISVEESGTELTYCFETETHNYIADGCCSHNCDFYGLTIKQEEQFAKEEGLLENISGSIDSGIFDSHVFVKVYLRACWWPTVEAVKAGKIEEEMKKDDYVLWFPERLTYEFLTLQKKQDTVDGMATGNFAIKYLNNPRKINRIKFPRELLVRRTIPHNQFPPQGIIVTAIDTAYSTKSWADFTVAITALIYGGRFYIINMLRGRFNEDELPKVIANCGYKWKPKRIAIEDSVGVKWFGKELRREMDKLQISIPVEYVTLGYGSKLRSKQLKAKPVLRMLGDERMYFLNSCEGLEDIYNELEKFTGSSTDQHDDIVSAISLLVEQFGSYADMDSRVNSINQDYSANIKSKAIHDKVYCLGKYAKYNDNGAIEENPKSAYQIAQIAQQVQEPYIDPLQDVMQ